ncbi:MAG TPA: HNH endonuclease signature motif containing protein [Patescibacteria group bacterium]|nr:HNH endonuclease signature motif containing protein [Patescibacteria group bacterium]
MSEYCIPWKGDWLRIQGILLINESRTIVVFNGSTYKKNKFGYFKGNGLLHRKIWEYQHGQIPENHHVHHVDGDKSNNSIENLELMSVTDHLRLHMSSHERKEMSRRSIGKAIEAARPWHSTPEGKEWHSEHAKSSFANRKELVHTCLCCAEVFKSVQRWAKYCSNSCKSEYRRKAGVDNETRKCEVCYEEFECNRYDTKVCCSSSCGAMFGHRKRSLRSYSRR